MARLRHHEIFKTSFGSGSAFFVVAFPKSGAYVGGVPIYVNYLLIAILLPFLSIAKIFSRSKTLYFRYFLACLPFVALWIMTFLFYGYSDFGFFVGQMFVVIILPVFFCAFEPVYRGVGVQYFDKWFVRVLRFVVMFGLLSFFYAIIYKDYIHIPYLTTGGGDVVEQVWQKNNMRSGILKLVSTYNNGNIFGVCMLMLLPLYFLSEKSGFFKLAFIFAVVLTLSRTVWLGLFVALFLVYGRRINPVTMFLYVLGGSIAFVAIYFLASLIGGDKFLFDSSLGGRDKFFWMLDELRFLPSRPIGYVVEIPYLSIYFDYGLFGLISFVVALLSPIFIGGMGVWREKSLRVAAANAGMIVYVCISLSDAALIFVPCFMIYSLLVMVKFSERIGQNAAAARRSSIKLRWHG